MHGGEPPAARSDYPKDSLWKTIEWGTQRQKFYAVIVCMVLWVSYESHVHDEAISNTDTGTIATITKSPFVSTDSI